MKKEYETIGNILHLLRQARIHPAYFLIPIILSLAAAVFDGIGMGLLIPMLQGFLTMDYSFITEIPGLSFIIAFLPESIAASDRTLFIFLSVVFVCAIILRNILKYCSIVSLSFVAYRAHHHLRKILFSRYLSFGKLFFDRTNIGHHSTLLSQFTEQALRPLLITNRCMQALFSLLAYLVVMSIISWKITLLAIPIFFVLHQAVKHIISRIKQLSRSIVEKASELGKKTIEILSTIPLVQAYGTERQEQDQYTVLSNKQSVLEFRVSALQNLINPVQEILALFAILLLFAGMLYIMVNEGKGTASSFIVFFYLILNATTKFGSLTGLRGSIAQASGPVQEIMEVLSDKEKYKVSSGTRSFDGLQSTIEFRNLHFSYFDGKEVLQDLSFFIEREKMTAIVGATGSGKTTIISLLMRYYDCHPESIFVDGLDIRQYKIPSLREHIALVSQETLLLNDTLRANITYGLGNVKEEKLEETIAGARLKEFIAGLPQGLNTLIGDRGVRLSGGEKQRISIARALLKNADILILDEATSSLDSKTEQLIQEAMDEAMTGKTAIVIAHRLSTIQNADTIIVIEDGKCIEKGTLKELLARKGFFHELWEKQKFS